MSDTILSEEVVEDVQPETVEPAAPVQAAKPSTFKDFIGDDGKINENYIAKYAEYDPDVDQAALKSILESNGYSLNKVTKQMLNLNKMLGKEKIPYPGENATAEDWQGFWKQVGAPGEDGEYKVSEDVKASFDETTLNGLLAMGKKAHIPQRLMNEIIPVIGEALSQQQEAITVSSEDAKRDALQQLEGVFGRHGTPEFTENITLAQKGLKIIAADAGISDPSGLVNKYGNDPFLLQVFAKRAREAGENGAPIGTTDGTLTTVTSLNDRIAAQEAKYFQSRAQKDMEKLMELREQRARLSAS